MRVVAGMATAAKVPGRIVKIGCRHRNGNRNNCCVLVRGLKSKCQCGRVGVFLLAMVPEALVVAYIYV